jgi:hypothetical protein
MSIFLFYDVTLELINNGISWWQADYDRIFKIVIRPQQKLDNHRDLGGIVELVFLNNLYRSGYSGFINEDIYSTLYLQCSTIILEQPAHQHNGIVAVLVSSGKKSDAPRTKYFISSLALWNVLLKIDLPLVCPLSKSVQSSGRA